LISCSEVSVFSKSSRIHWLIFVKKWPSLNELKSNEFLSPLKFPCPNVCLSGKELADNQIMAGNTLS
jgi:hypothetical protein